MKKLFIFFSILFAVACIMASTQKKHLCLESDGNVSTISSADVDSVSFSIQWLLNITTSSPVNVTTNSFNAMTSVSLNKKVNFSRHRKGGYLKQTRHRPVTMIYEVLGKKLQQLLFLEFLDASTTYYYRTYVKLLNEVVYGDVCSVTTKARSSADNSCTINGYKFVDLGLPSCLLYGQKPMSAHQHLTRMATILLGAKPNRSQVTQRAIINTTTAANMIQPTAKQFRCRR